MVFAFILNRLGKSIAALIDARLFERIHRMQGRFDALSQRLAQDFAQTPPDEGLAEINAAVAELRPRVVRLSQSKK